MDAVVGDVDAVVAGAVDADADVDVAVDEDDAVGAGDADDVDDAGDDAAPYRLTLRFFSCRSYFVVVGS